MTKITKVLTKLENAGLKVNANRSNIYQPEVEQLGILIIRKGIKPQPRKVEAIYNMVAPKTRGEVRIFLGIANCYRDISVQRSDMFTPLSGLILKRVAFKWGNEE